MDIVFEELAKEHPVTQFLRVSLELEHRNSLKGLANRADYDSVSQISANTG